MSPLLFPAFMTVTIPRMGGKLQALGPFKAFWKIHVTDVWVGSSLAPGLGTVWLNCPRHGPRSPLSVVAGPQGPFLPPDCLHLLRASPSKPPWHLPVSCPPCPSPWAWASPLPDFMAVLSIGGICRPSLTGVLPPVSLSCFSPWSVFRGCSRALSRVRLE